MIKWFEKNNKISWMITMLIAIAIFYISTLTFGPSSRITGNKSIIYHIGIFFLFSLFLLISSVKGGKKSLIPIAVIIAIFYGVLDEFHQYYIPGRFFSIFDMMINTLGILIASVIYLISIYKRQHTF